ncbi:hypothetical protein BH20BAC1_BH20BAC1_22360 [soil metagenome]
MDNLGVANMREYMLISEFADALLNIIKMPVNIKEKIDISR